MQVGALRAQLERKHTAHEAANVQAILGSAAAVPRVITTITAASERLSDLSLTLDMFDGKLTSMRDDIGSIEMRNNSLETQTRSLESLRTAVTELLHTLSVRPSPTPPRTPEDTTPACMGRRGVHTFRKPPWPAVDTSPSSGCALLRTDDSLDWRPSVFRLPPPACAASVSIHQACGVSDLVVWL